MASQTGESSRFAAASRTATCLDPNRVDERHLTRPGGVSGLGVRVSSSPMPARRWMCMSREQRSSQAGRETVIRSSQGVPRAVGQRVLLTRARGPTSPFLKP